jgi:hypothetical protein
MRRKKSPCLITFRHIPPPALTPRATDVPLETFHSPLHVPPPDLLDSDDSLPAQWYCSIPLQFLVVASAARSQPLAQATLRVQIQVENSVEYDSESVEPVDLEPPRSLSLFCQFSSPAPGPVTFCANSEFACDQKRGHSQEIVVVNFVQPLKISVRFLSPHLCYDIEVCVPFPVWDLSVAVRGGEKRVLARLLQSGESVQGIMEVNAWQPLLFVSWNLPFARDLRCQTAVPPLPAVDSHPVQVTFLDAPPFAQPFAPFNVKVRIQNGLSRILEGEMRVSLSSNSIIIYGEDRICFVLQPGEECCSRLTFVAQVEGDFPFPPCEFTIIGEEKFAVQPSEGILVVGSERREGEAEL